MHGVWATYWRPQARRALATEVDEACLSKEFFHVPGEYVCYLRLAIRSA